MSYRVEPSAWAAAFAVPSQVVDKHLRMAGATQLKALLWLLRHASEEFTIEEMAKAIGQQPADTVDALQYWVECKIISKNNLKAGQSAKAEEDLEPAKSKKEKQAKPKETKKEVTKEKILPELTPPPPTYEQIAARAKESEEIRFLFNEAQQKLGRTIGFDAQSTLLMMHDQYGLPVEVILMILEYAASVNKRSHSYILSVGRNWAENEIDTIEKADERITQLQTVNSVWKSFSAMAGLPNPRPTASQSRHLKVWIEELKFNVEMIYLAYEQMANHCQRLSMPYMDKVLRSWHSKGIKTPTDVENANEEFMNKKRNRRKAADTGGQASYGLNSTTVPTMRR